MESSHSSGKTMSMRVQKSATNVPVLIPILPPTKSSHHKKRQQFEKDTNKRRPLPYIVLPTSSSKLIIGRAELILTTASACQCLSPTSLPSSNSSNSKDVTRVRNDRYRPSCDYCQTLKEWACRLISKQMVQITYNSESQQKEGEREWKILCIGQNSKHIIRILQPQEQKDSHDYDRYITNDVTDVDWKNGKKEFLIRPGTIIRFINPDDNKNKMNDSDNNNVHKNQKGERNQKEFNDNLVRNIEFKVSYINETKQCNNDTINIKSSQRTITNEMNHTAHAHNDQCHSSDIGTTTAAAACRRLWFLALA